MKNKEKKFDFYFPSEVLKKEDFSPVEIFVLKDYYRNTFLELIDKIGEDISKKLFIDQYCFGVLNHLLTPVDFSSKHFDSSNIFVIDENQKDLGMIEKITEEAVIFIVRPEKKIFNVIIQMYFMLKAIRQNLIKYLIFIPGENHDIIEYMNENNVINEFIIETLNFDLIPIDIDLLSLERDNCIKEIYIDNNYISISDLACALVKLETCFGKVQHKYIKGDLAQTFCSIVEEKEIENNLKTNDEILGMVVLDRSVDFISLMTTNYTIEGLIDDAIGINLGRIKIQENILKENLSKNPIENKKLIPYGLTSKHNPLYCSFRCMHYADALKYINLIKEYYKKLADESQDKTKKLSFDKIKHLTEELNYYISSIRDNLTMNENIINYIVKPIRDSNYLKFIEKEQLMLAGDLPNNLYNYYDEHLCEQRDLISLIKLMILESLTQNGVKDYQKLKREILNIYGYQNIFLFRDLESIGWLKEKEILKNLRKVLDISHSKINENLQLIKTSDNSAQIEDCSYLLGGFCPLGLRLIERALEGKWSKIIDTLKKLPGATNYPIDESVFSNPTKDKNIIFIVFVGGVTYTEIEGIRFLNRKYNEEYKNKKRKKRTQFIILTTGILNSKKIFGNLGKDIHSSLNMKQFYEQNQK